MENGTMRRIVRLAGIGPPRRGPVVLVAALILSLAGAACDSRSGGSQESSSAASSAGGSGCAATLSDFSNPAEFCTADAGAAGGDVMCYTVDGIGGVDPATVHVVVEPVSDLYGYYHLPDTGSPATSVGLVMGMNPGEDDGISLLIGAGPGTTGVFPLGRFSSWSGPDQENYRAIGQDEGCGLCQITAYGAETTGRLTGRFDARLCAYNSTTHQVHCSSGEVRLKGAFDLTRAANVTGGSGTPFDAEFSSLASD
jgi:hypothetical protein